MVKLTETQRYNNLSSPFSQSNPAKKPILGTFQTNSINSVSLGTLIGF